MKHLLKVLQPLLGILITVFSTSVAAQTQSWEQTNGPFGGTILSIAITSNGYIFVGTVEGGIYCSTDDGQSWSSLSLPLLNLAKTEVNALATNSDGHIYAGIEGGTNGAGRGVYLSTDYGENWVLIGLEDHIRSLVVRDDGDIFAGAGGIVYHTTDNGQSWTNLCDYGCEGFGGDVNALAINNNGYIFAGKVGLFRSKDNGETWEVIAPHLVTTIIYDIAINSDGYIFIGTAEGVFRSEDEGSTWSERSRGLNYTTVLSLGIRANGSILTGTSYSGVFQAAFNGTGWFDWSNANTGLKNTFVNDLKIDPDKTIYAAAGRRVFYSYNSGDTWIPVGTGLTSTDVVSLAINAGGQIFAGTYLDGIFKSTYNGGTWIKIMTKLLGSDGSIFIDDNGCIFVGGDGISVSCDNGETWSNAVLRTRDVFVFTQIRKIFW